jgi:hypothetical protein
MASHSADGTEDKSRLVAYFRLRSVSHIQVLISYKVGYGSHADTAVGALILSTRVALIVMSPHETPVNPNIRARMLMP